jgi:hypothetical protein
MKTAVEWLVEEFDLEMQDTFNHKINKAKEMDKAERAKEYLNGFKDGKEYMKKYKLLN